MNSNEKQYLRPGDVVVLRMPWSEVCMDMKIAGQVRPVRLERHQAQILDHKGGNFSFPVNTGEAGIYLDRSCGKYYVPKHEAIEYRPRPQTTVVLYIERKTGDRTTQCCNEGAVTAVLDRYQGDYDATWENDRLGRRVRVTLPTTSTALLNPPPADRLRRIALSVGVPAAIED